MGLMQEVLKAQMKATLPTFNIGDVVDVSVKIKEGEKERVQVYTGTVIARRGCGMDEMFTVRRIVAGEGVERMFPIHAPNIASITVQREGHVRRAKLYYLRERTGKSARIKEKRREKTVVPGAEAPKE